MQRLFGWLGRRRWFVSIPILLVAGVVSYLLVYSLLEWAASTEFCGTTCHIMTPEYTAYQESFHSRVSCSECHVGPGLGAEVRAKWEGVRELYLNVTRSYELPIPSPVESLRPARETCEHCHWPEVFYEDRAIEIAHYGSDEENTRTNTYIVTRIGGGTERRGQGRGIHWHIENVVEYIATDPQRQNIPWVRAQLDGEVVTFSDITQPLSEEELAQYDVRVMDCIDCHNRATHVFPSSSRALDEAMGSGLLPTDIPYFRREALTRMEGTYASQDEARAGIAGLMDYYAENYPEIYRQRRVELYEAVIYLWELYSYSRFPSFEVFPDTYPDNIGHSEFPGCFRCHDGKHLTEDGESIRLHCNICHTIPETVAEGEPVPEIPFAQGMEPPSHLASDWMANHRYVLDETCASCHDMQTYCANVNCHGRSWPYVDLAVIEPPFPLPEAGQPIPSPTVGAEPTESAEPPPVTELPSFSAQILPPLQERCGASCHSAASALGGFVAEDYASISAVIVPGDPEASPLVQVQQAQHPAHLTPQEMDLLIAWIRAGAPEN